MYITDYQIYEINCWLESNISAKQYPKLYTPYRYKDYIIILGEHSGIVAFRENNSNNIGFVALTENNCQYWVTNTHPIEKKNHDFVHSKNVIWLEDEIKCYQTLISYLQQGNM